MFMGYNVLGLQVTRVGIFDEYQDSKDTSVDGKSRDDSIGIIIGMALGALVLILLMAYFLRNQLRKQSKIETTTHTMTPEYENSLQRSQRALSSSRNRFANFTKG